MIGTCQTQKLKKLLEIWSIGYEDFANWGFIPKVHSIIALWRYTFGELSFSLGAYKAYGFSNPGEKDEQRLSEKWG